MRSERSAGARGARQPSGSSGRGQVEALFLRYHDDLLAWVGVRYGNDLAEDVVATVFLKLLRGHLPDPERDPWPW